VTNLEAGKILEVAPDATPEQLEVRYLELRTRLEDKIAKAPTPGLKVKYRDALVTITTAFETLSLNADSSVLPVLGKDASKASGDAPVSRPAVTNANAEMPAPIPKARPRIVLCLAVAFVGAALGGGAWWEVDRRAEAEERIRLEKLRQATLLVEMRGRLAELNVRFEALLATEASAERALRDLRTRQRDARRDNSPDDTTEQRAVDEQIKAQSEFANWLQATLTDHPARIGRARATELVSAGMVEPALAAVQTYQERIAGLKKEIENRAPDLSLFARRVHGEPILAQWRELLAAELEEDKKAVSWLPEGATRSSADRDVALKVIEKFGANPADIPADIPAALLWLERLSAEEDPRLLLLIADAYRSSQKVAYDEDKMWAWRYRAAEAGDAETKYTVAVTPYDQFLPWNLGTRVRWLRQAAEAGHAKAALELSHYGGRAVEKPFFGTIEEERQKVSAGEFIPMQMVWCFENVGSVPLPMEEAVEWLMKLAAQGNIEAIKRLGVRYALGDGVEMDWERAVEYFRQSAEHPDSQHFLGEAYANGWGVEQNDEQAFAWHLRAARALKAERFGDWRFVAPSMLEVGRRYADGVGVARDQKEAIAWLLQAAVYRTQSSEAAAVLQAIGLAPNGLPWPDAVKSWLAESSDKWNQLSLGDAYERGLGVAPDPVAAFEWYGKAARQNAFDAKRALAKCYAHGIGVAKDENKAFELYKETGGDEAAAFFRARGLGPSGETWTEWFESLRADGELRPWAANALGEVYEHGLGVQRDPAVAFEWYRKAAGGRIPEAMLALGRCYANGTGVTRNREQAIHWIWRAASHGIAEAKAELKKLRDLKNES
jgi:TPR repeat protein